MIGVEMHPPAVPIDRHMVYIRLNFPDGFEDCTMEEGLAGKAGGRHAPPVVHPPCDVGRFQPQRVGFRRIPQGDNLLDESEGSFGTEGGGRAAPLQGGSFGDQPLLYVECEEVEGGVTPGGAVGVRPEGVEGKVEHALAPTERSGATVDGFEGCDEGVGFGEDGGGTVPGSGGVGGVGGWA